MEIYDKNNILDKVLKTFPREIENYHELFVGGGSVLFGFLLVLRYDQILSGIHFYLRYSYDHQPLLWNLSL